MGPFKYKRVALIGSSGMLAQAVKKELPATIALLELDLPGFDVTDISQVQNCLGAFRPDVVKPKKMWPQR